MLAQEGQHLQFFTCHGHNELMKTNDDFSLAVKRPGWLSIELGGCRAVMAFPPDHEVLLTSDGFTIGRHVYTARLEPANPAHPQLGHKIVLARDGVDGPLWN